MDNSNDFDPRLDRELPLELLLDLQTAEEAQQESIARMRSFFAREESLRRERVNAESPEHGGELAGPDDSYELELAKCSTSEPGARRRLALLAWLRGELALGKSVAELVAFARRHDLATGNLIAEVASEAGLS